MVVRKPPYNTVSDGLVAAVFPTFRDVCCFKKKHHKMCHRKTSNRWTFISYYPADERVLVYLLTFKVDFDGKCS